MSCVLEWAGRSRTGSFRTFFEVRDSGSAQTGFSQMSEHIAQGTAFSVWEQNSGLLISDSLLFPLQPLPL